MKFFAILLFLLVTSVNNAAACSCPPPNTERTMANADVVFVGKAIKIETSDDNVEQFTIFNVIKMIKGKLSDNIIVIKTNVHGLACGWTFNLDETVTIAAYKRGEYYETSSCDMYAMPKNKN